MKTIYAKRVCACAILMIFMYIITLNAYTHEQSSQPASLQTKNDILGDNQAETVSSNEDINHKMIFTHDTKTGILIKLPCVSWEALVNRGD